MAPSKAAAAKAEQHSGEINTLVTKRAGNFMARTEKLTPNALSRRRYRC